MITRVWRGWTKPDRAQDYERLIRETIFPGILGRRIDGLDSVELLRRDSGDEVEFMTLMRFASLDAVKAFAGPGYETSVVPPAARAILSRYDATAQHFDTRVGDARAGAGS